MTTTTQITNIATLLDLTAYAGDFLADYDMDAVHSEYVSLINADLPDGITVCANGDVIADIDLADQARDIDFGDLTNERDVTPIFERNEHRTAVVDPEDMRDLGTTSFGGYVPTEALIRIVNPRGVELDTVTYAPADDETEAWARVQVALADAGYAVQGEWDRNVQHVSRATVTVV